MGWAFCGTDSKGRDIGYGIPATCDHAGCEKKIDRGLAFACGGMHGSDWCFCEDYFCDKHLTGYVPGEHGRLCFECWGLVEKCEYCGEAVGLNGVCEEQDNPHGPEHPEPRPRL